MSSLLDILSFSDLILQPRPSAVETRQSTWQNNAADSLHTAMTERANQLTMRAKGQDRGDLANNAGTVRVFVNALERLGYSKESLLAQAGVSRSDFDDPNAHISCVAMGAVLCAAMQERPMKNLAMRIAAETPIGAFPLIDYLVVTSENVGEGLKQLARYFRLVDAPYTLDLREDGDPIHVLFHSPANPFSVEFGVTLTVLHLREETENRLRAAFANFGHCPDDMDEIERTLRCPIHTDASWSGFALSREAWQLPLRRRDPVLRQVLEQHANEIAAQLPARDGVARDVSRVIASRFAKGDVQIQSVARALAISTRSLQRRLAAAGVTYQDLLDQTRREAANRYLRVATFSIGDVAYLLGYSEAAAFHRAFKRWTGMGPQEFRVRQREDGRPGV
jgi:AraC-like DNA-binding protein